MNLTEEQLKSIEDFAYRLILPSMIAINLGVDEFSFIEAIRTVGSPIRSAYYRGYLKQLVETREALIKAHREDLIGSGPKCLIRVIPPKTGKPSAPPPKAPAKKPGNKPLGKPTAKAGTKTSSHSKSAPARAPRNSKKK